LHNTKHKQNNLEDMLKHAYKLDHKLKLFKILKTSETIYNNIFQCECMACGKRNSSSNKQYAQ